MTSTYLNCEDLKVANRVGRVFLVRTVLKGDRYGLNDALVHDENSPMIEFYDFTYAGQLDFGRRGQFVSRYYAKTLRNFRGGTLELDGGVPEWILEPEALRPVLDLAHNLSEVTAS